MLIDIFIIVVVFSPALERYNDEHIHRCFFQLLNAMLRNAVRDFITLFTKYKTYLFYVIILLFFIIILSYKKMTFF